MADAPVLPGKEQIVTQDVLLQAQYAQWRNVAAFSGVKDPTSIWAMMVRGESSSIPFYRELEDKDDDVSAALDELKLSVLERDWTILPGDKTQAALDAAAFAKQQLELIDVDSSFDAMLDACAYGFTVQEMMFDTSEGQASIVSVDDCPQELFLFGDRFRPQTGPLQLLSSVGASSGQLVPEEKFLVFSYRGRSRSRVGRPLLQRAFWPSWIKRQILAFWLRAGEKANGMAITRYEESADDSRINLALEIAEALAQGVAFAAPEGMVIDTDLLKAAQAGKTDVYKELFLQMQYSIARAIKGETLTSMGSEGGHGSHTQGKTHQQTFDKRSISLAKKHARVVNMQYLRRLHLWNYGPNVAAPVFAWDTAEEEDLVQKGTLYSIAQRIGVPIGAAWAADQLQIPPVGEGDVPLVPNANAPTEAAPASVFSEADKTKVQIDLKDLDKLAAQLREESLSLFATRTKEIAERLS
ncbi:DUF935 domain-containing protein [Granulicella cerasi]|uniref:DUF935 domain-containing protein n=1 Tax=Granulicella cerasi TaxID=741063 RepID=A0ABW1ZA94_9BACT|nr:DUF935 domain-containing protein [Granulicella cerasi]